MSGLGQVVWPVRETRSYELACQESDALARTGTRHEADPVLLEAWRREARAQVQLIRALYLRVMVACAVGVFAAVLALGDLMGWW
jgi:hypothetical protein